MTIREALRGVTERLESHRVSNARLTAEVLLAHCLAVDREYLYTHDERMLHSHEAQALEDAVYDRISGVPLQYIVGRQEFYGRYFQVTPAVLIPRPETEHIVESVLEIMRISPRPYPVRVIDVGTGSGCIAVTLALEIPRSEIFGGDISKEALDVARGNASRAGATVGFVCMDVLDAVVGPFDFVVSNPPYVRLEDIHRLQREVREHEPRVALFSPCGDDLAIYRRLAAEAREKLRPGGYLIMEIAIGMEDKVSQLLSDGWARLPTKTDLQGIPRTVIGRKN